MARPGRIILVRHGESQANADASVRAVTPDHQLALTPGGYQQARAAGEKIAEMLSDQTLRAYVSPYRRTRQTFEELCTGWADEVKLVGSYEDPRLREQDFGHLRAVEAHRLIEAERRQFGSFFYRIPDGESGADVYDRMSSFMETLFRDFAKADYPQNALLVTHGLTIRLFLMRWFHWSVEKFERLRNPGNCEIFVMALNPQSGKYTLQTPIREFTEEETKKWREGDVAL
jgi:broad specificity phosphatase PhoE